MADYSVVWDGRKQGPGGALLFGPESEARQPDLRTVVSLAAAREAILLQLRRQPQTMRELAAASGLSMDAINGALYRMRKVGDVAVVDQRSEGGRWGRKTENIYGLTEGQHHGC
ncbi:MAG: hypothetical protein Q8O42_09695 [Acidobacteriota bacterium]|nr:hypothetical protein [Acidobacteriota bacterium]